MIKKSDFLHVALDLLKVKVDWERMNVVSLAFGHEFMGKKKKIFGVLIQIQEN